MVALFKTDSFDSTAESELEFLIFALIFALLNVQGGCVGCAWSDGELEVERIERRGGGCCGDILASGTDVDGTQNGVGTRVRIPLLQSGGGAGFRVVQLKRRIGALEGANLSSAEEGNNDVFHFIQVGLIAS